MGKKGKNLARYRGKGGGGGLFLFPSLPIFSPLSPNVEPVYRLPSYSFVAMRVSIYDDAGAGYIYEKL